MISVDKSLVCEGLASSQAGLAEVFILRTEIGVAMWSAGIDGSFAQTVTNILGTDLGRVSDMFL